VIHTFSVHVRASRRGRSAVLEELHFALGEKFGFERFERFFFRFTVKDTNPAC
jgi:hypothetical protein